MNALKTLPPREVCPICKASRRVYESKYYWHCSNCQQYTSGQ